MLLIPQRFVARGLFQLCKVLESSTLNAPIVRRIVSNSGCLVAGCCFSRQSESDSLLSTAEENHAVLDTNTLPNDWVQSHSTNAEIRESTNMKRSPEFNDNVVSEDSNANYCTEQTLDKPNKRRRISDGETEKAEHTEIEPLDSTSDIVLDRTREEKTELPQNKKKETFKKLRPNYFVAVKISNQEIHEKLKNIQNHILEKESKLNRSMIELKTLHITLMVMYIGDTETHGRAMEALKRIHKEYDEEMSDNPLQLEFKGLGHFQNRVLYAKLSTDDSYERLCNLAEGVKKHFAANSIFATDSRTTFTPHLTVAKIDFKKKQNRFIKKIDPELYKDFVDQYFGSQTIESIQLLSMTDPKNDEGYYSGNEIYFRAFDPDINTNNLSDLLEVEKKKKDIKELINSLMKEKLK